MEDEMINDVYEALKVFGHSWPESQAKEFVVMLRAALPHLELYDLSGRGREEDMQIVERDRT